MIRLYESGLGWIYGSDQPYKIEIAENELQPVAGQIVAHYQDGTWRMVRRAPGTASASPVPSLSPSASAEGTASAEATAAGSAEATTASAEASAQ